MSKSKRFRDTNLRAKQVVDIATDEPESVNMSTTNKTIAAFPVNEDNLEEENHTLNKSPSSKAISKKKTRSKTTIKKKKKEQPVLASIIAEKKEARSVLENEIKELNNEIRILEKVSTQITSKKQTKQQGYSQKKSPGRPLAQKWKEVLNFIKENSGVSIDEIMEFIELKSHSISRNNLKVQLHAYQKRGWVERNHEDVYIITDLGNLKLN